MYHPSGPTVGARVRAARLAKKYTQNRLARPDFSVSYISAIERDQIQPSLRALTILAERLEVSATDLLPPRAVLPEVLSSQDRADPSRDEARELLLLEAQIALYQGRPAQALTLLHTLREQNNEVPTTSEQSSQALLLLLLGRAYLAQGVWQESERALAEAARLSGEIGDPLSLHILVLQYTVYSSLRNIEQTTQTQRKIQHLLASCSETITHPVLFARLHLALAQHAGYLENFAQAYDHLQHALHLFAYQRLPEAHYQLITSCAEKEDFLTISILYHKAEITEMQTYKRDIEYALARAYVMRHASDEAYLYLRQLSQEAEARRDCLALAGTHAQLAAWMVAREDFTQAEQLICLALEETRPFGTTLIGSHAHLLAGQLAYRRQDYPTGDEHFTTGLAMLESLQAEEDLLAYLTHYAQLLETNGFTSQALACWKKVYEKHQQKTKFAAGFFRENFDALL